MCARLLKSCSTLCNPMNCSPPDSSVHVILQARILEWVAMSSSRGSSQLRDRTCVSCASCIGKQVLYHQHHLGSPRKQVESTFHFLALPFLPTVTFFLCYYQLGLMWVFLSDIQQLIIITVCPNKYSTEITCPLCIHSSKYSEQGLAHNMLSQHMSYSCYFLYLPKLDSFQRGKQVGSQPA